MKFTISSNQNLVDIAKRGIEILATNLTIHLEAWGKTTLPNIKAENLSEFATNPKTYFDKALIEQAKEKGLIGIVPAEYAKLFNITFLPNLQRHPIELKYMESVRLAKGNKVVPVSDYLDRIKDLGTTVVSDPKEIEAAKMILDTFKKFTYIATMLSGNGLIQTAGTERIGFSLLNMGSITPETVNQLAAKMAEVPMDQWEQRLVEQFHNPGLVGTLI